MRLVFLLIRLLSISLTATSFILDARRLSNALVRGYSNRQKQTTNNLSLISIDSASLTRLAMSAGQNNDQKVVITDLARYAIKGFSGDSLASVAIPRGGVQTFPDDRRFALLKESNHEKFDPTDPKWLHKENFLCAFSAPELLAGFRSHYEIVERGDDGDGDGETEQQQQHQRRLLTLYRRTSEGDDASAEPVLGPIDLGLPSGRDELASFFSDESNQPLVCVTKKEADDGTASTFQFGNTRAGVKHNPGGDTRTVHIVNSATVREFSETTGLTLNAMRFRPNIVIDGLDPWEEFNWVGRTLRVVPKTKEDGTGDGDTDTAANANANPNTSSQIIVKVLTKTVRCEGIGIDPLDPSSGKLDMPKLLSKNYPEHGPYLGVYASLEVMDGEDESTTSTSSGGKLFLSVGDTLELL